MDRSKKPSVIPPSSSKLISDPAVSEGLAAAAHNGPSVPDRSAKPTADPSRALSAEQRREIQKDTLDLMETARREQEQRRRAQEQEKLEDKQQDRRKLERQTAEEEDLKETSPEDKSRKTQKDIPADAPMKSMSLDSPAPFNAVSEHTHTHTQQRWFLGMHQIFRCRVTCVCVCFRGSR